jgi:hypothetical protein
MKRFILCLCLLLPQTLLADDRWDDAIIELIIKAHAYSDTTTGRIEYLTREFVATENSYVAEPLGEGQDSYFSQKPLYRLDVFDCTTFVETMLAMAVTPLNAQRKIILQDFQNNINAIRYKQGIVSFYTRNHFPSADWIPNNIAAGFVEDISNEVAQRFGETQTLPAYINKQSWYEHLTIDRICIAGEDDSQYPNCSASEDIREQRLVILKQTGHEQANNTFSSIPYLPLWEIFAPRSDTEQQLREIPSGAILQFVRPRYDLVEWIGTRMHVSHQGIVVHKANQVMLRHASTTTDKVTEEPLKEYLEKYWLSESCNRAWDDEYRNCMRGINILLPR